MVLKIVRFENRSDMTENFRKWYWRRMEKIIWTDRVRNEEVLQIESR